MTKYEKLSRDRKRLQSENLAPDWLSTAGFQLLTEKNYLDTAETPLKMYQRIADRATELTNVAIPTDWVTLHGEMHFLKLCGWVGYPLQLQYLLIWVMIEVIL